MPAPPLAALLAVCLLTSGAASAGIAFPGPEAFSIISGLRNDSSATSSGSGATQVGGASPGIDAACLDPGWTVVSPFKTTTNQLRGADPVAVADSRLAVDAMFRLASRLESLLRDPSSTNVLHSPVGLVAALGQLALAARGSTLQQLTEVLAPGCGTPFHAAFRAFLSKLRRDAAVHNALFFQQQTRLDTAFADAVARYYATDVLPTDFSSSPIFAQQQINVWARKASKGKIEQLMPFIPPRSTTAVLGSVVHFKALWEEPFSRQFTSKGTFYLDGDHRGRTKSVDFMSAEFEVPYAESQALGCKMVALPYKNNETAMYLFLPLGNSRWKSPPHTAAIRRREAEGPLPEGQSPFSGARLHELANRLGAAAVEALASSARTVRASVFLPRLSLSSNVKLREALTALGAGAILGEGADFSGAVAEGGKWGVDEVWQQSRLEVTEEGTEAASGTAAVIVDYGLDSAVFKANSPFLAVLRHEASGAPLFWASVANPS